MRPILTLSACLLAISVNAFAGQQQTESSHLGFFEINSENIPAPVRTAAQSVVLIITPEGKLTTVGEVFGPLLGNVSFQEIVKRVESKAVSQDFVAGEKDLYLYELRQCAKSPDPMTCKMYEGDKISAGYIIGDGSRVRTAFHAVEDLVGDAIESGNVMAGKIQVWIYDSSGKPLWSPESGLVPAFFSTANLAALQKRADGTIIPPNEDLAEIQLDRRIGPAVPHASVLPNPGETIYQIGFPQRSADRVYFNAPDAPGAQLRIAYGRVLTIEETAAKLGIQMPYLSYESKRILNMTVVTDADGGPGLSGGPAVNAKGEVIGTYTAGNPADGHASKDHLSYISKF